ncbi:MAG: SPOR domain-containing protein [Tannerellaceae bacterium]|jgi:cell division septation protein DedD|nr:SPOR domain-containing protein [Tannerellaceae bacterium]
MLRIVSHIERLLLVHDCVIVPQFGGFVLQSVPASFVRGDHLFSPMHKEMMFNSTLQHNDGLLPESYMKEYGVNYRRAYLMLEEDVEEIKSVLQKKMVVSLGAIGSFHIGKEGQVVFQAGDTEVISVDSYGLQPFQFKTLQALQQEGALSSGGKRKRDAYYIPVNRGLLRGIASAAAAITLFLAVSTPVKELNVATYTASFIPVEMTANPVKTIVPERTPVQTAATPGPAKRAETTPVRREKREQVKDRAAYHIIIGSVQSDRQADEFIARVNRSQFKQVRKLLVNGRIRISAGTFSGRGQAEAYLAKVRRHTRYHDAWLFTAHK